MSITSAQMMLHVASAESAAPSSRSTPASVPSAAPGEESSADSPSPASLIASTNQFSNDLQVDSHHQFYYECVDNSTGDVLFEIPPAALRAIGESLNLPLSGDAGVPSIDVKT